VTLTEGVPRDGTVIVVGASLAGLRATETLREEGFTGKITLVGQELHLPYDRPPLSKQVLAGTWPPEKAVLADRKRAGELQLHEVLGHRAVRLDAEKLQVEIDDGTEFTGDALIVATGASPRHLPGTEGLTQRDGLFTLRTLDDSVALRAAVTAVDSSRVVVIGAGYIGAEVASTCAGLGCRVTVVETLEVPLSNVVGPLIGAHCASLYAANGVELRTGHGVAGIHRAEGTPGAGGLIVDADDGERIEADVVVVGIGVAPAVDWLADSGLTVETGSSRRTVSWRPGMWPGGYGATTGTRSRSGSSTGRWRQRPGWQRPIPSSPDGATPHHSLPSRTSGRISSASVSRRSETPAGTTRSRSSMAPSKRGSSWRSSGGPVVSGPSWPSGGRAS
jgi:NADH dehydrogenase FAD-containing subunit